MDNDRFWFICSKQKEWGEIFRKQRKREKLTKSREEKKRYNERNNINVVYNESLDCTRKILG